ncbi:Stk1 family PASTA domain-containing Ser/Thr kinase [Paenibacillus taichungensis]|uniref:non-specific serine/threonine protein kinase n=1 Tax=Paenibacillus taichungensis TaxID=484184 RepID=A0ABX2MSZ9_9BACL|nr:Stk1 family PASTA domain-containing Ser/Thr kinase [Paenibacillus taichungensis]MDR9747005.1 Stk1 family PASTA domain-containing Ser/Thr kinase [Paenibacillus taichungensis]MEC0108196.1 Stk1 family PASTA domain-containing Ser/Thr kinase [Paenibacillus taichungensis]MEC0199758.1 Stk1 family PASTA domain-containing Ser/Thr kinase [Paenibacillus taichungensis]NUU57199.1 Stk1 family PASTA domain-containing Ser/Thr kinase [Paenibacillus taichungensis]
MIGHQLGGRYEVIERVGGGGMALVYKAQDLLLNRNVAIKVLRQQFVHDEEFIRRFRREAQSAASLSHPNVVSVYDVGQEDDVHYIVMEYVEGKNLNEIIKERAPLQVDEAVRIASQIADALDHAHHNQIIHRDIKPHNILIGRNGRVKVTDFGIARAVTSTTITQTGSVVGSVHYFSPEHAKGIVTGEKSDLYSLGIVLYQMLTGQLPFLGESPISVALKHLQEEFDEPRKFNPLIPQSVENVILKSMRKNPQERYQSAKEMQTDLETCLMPERRNETKIDFPDEDDIDQTRVMPAIKPEPRGVTSTGAIPVMESDQDNNKGKTKTKNWKKPALLISLTVLILIAMVGVVWYVKGMLVVPDVTVPNVIGQTEEKARQMLQDQGLVVSDNVIREYKEDVDPGIVFDQTRNEGDVVKEGSEVQLSVGAEKELLKMIDLKDLSYDEAVKQLTELDIKEDQIQRKEEFSNDKSAGTVLSQTPGVNVEYDPAEVQIVLTVSKGSETIKMPDLKNRTRSEAESMLKSAGLILAQVQEESSYTVDEGKVTQQWPVEAGADVNPGDKITIFISTGYPPEALNYAYNINVSPKEEGKNSKIRITFEDARGKSQEWGTRTIKSAQMLTIPLILAPNVDGVVSVYRDGQFLDTYLVSYSDAKNGTVVVPTIEPEKGAEPPPTTEEPEQGGGGDEGTVDTQQEGEPDTPVEGEGEHDEADTSAMKNGNGLAKGKDKKKEVVNASSRP